VSGPGLPLSSLFPPSFLLFFPFVCLFIYVYNLYHDKETDETDVQDSTMVSAAAALDRLAKHCLRTHGEVLGLGFRKNAIKSKTNNYCSLLLFLFNLFFLRGSYKSRTGSVLYGLLGTHPALSAIRPTTTNNVFSASVAI
jgi:hypothetical protein